MTRLEAPARCIACGTAPVRGLTLPGDVPLRRCPRCGLQWWNWPRFDPTRFYDQAYFQSETDARGYDDYASLEAGVRRTARARLDRIASLLGPRPGVRLFEIGCGTGLFLHEARKRGWEARGIEVSEYGASAARQRGLDVQSRAIEDADLPEADQDVVAMWDVIEHLRDPAGALECAGRALRPGGVLALSTGDVTSLCARWSGSSWHLYTLPEHLFFFSPEALRRLLRRAGCDPSRTVRETNWVPLRYIFERLRKSRGVLGRISASAPLRALASRLGGCVVPATLLDVIGMYAVRGRTGAAIEPGA